MFETTTTTEAEANHIPREFKISNPLPPYVPKSLPALDEFPRETYRTFDTFISTLLPEYDLDINVHESPALQAVRKVYETNTPETKLINQLIVRQFLLTCQTQLIKLMSKGSLTKLSLLHHELYQISDLIHEFDIQGELNDFCDMMMAEAIDLYHNTFSDIVEQKFWSKTKSVDELINTLLSKEFEKIRTLNPYTYKQLTSVALHKVIDSAPSSSVNTVLQWMKDQNLNLE